MYGEYGVMLIFFVKKCVCDNILVKKYLILQCRLR